MEQVSRLDRNYNNYNYPSVLVYVQSLSHVVQVLGGPLLLLLQEREKRNQAAIQKLTQQKERLEQELSDQMEKLAPLDNNTDSNHSSSLDMIV